MPSLIYKRPGDQDTTLEFGPKPLIIGRVNESNLIVRDSFVSRVHCGISCLENQFTLKDLGSTNGTYRNGARVFETPLTAGDKIQVGNTTLVFEIEDGTGNGILRQIQHLVAPAAKPAAKPVTIQIQKPSGPPTLRPT